MQVLTVARLGLIAQQDRLLPPARSAERDGELGTGVRNLTLLKLMKPMPDRLKSICIAVTRLQGWSCWDSREALIAPLKTYVPVDKQLLCSTPGECDRLYACQMTEKSCVSRMRERSIPQVMTSLRAVTGRANLTLNCSKKGMWASYGCRG